MHGMNVSTFFTCSKPFGIRKSFSCSNTYACKCQTEHANCYQICSLVPGNGCVRPVLGHDSYCSINRILKYRFTLYKH